MVVHEIIHSLTSTKNPIILFKLDLSKAFGKLNQAYLFQELTTFVFDKELVTWIKFLITSGFFSMLLDGSLLGPFFPSLGIH